VLVFDAAALEEGPVCTLPLPARVPAGFHSLWVPGARL